MLKQTDLPEFTGQIIDVFEDFLEARGVELDNNERDENDDFAAIIYGSDYDDLRESIVKILNGWGLIATSTGPCTDNLATACDKLRCALNENNKRITIKD